MKKLKIAVIFHQIGPYHHARLNAIGKLVDVVGIEWSAKEIESWGIVNSNFSYEKVSLFNYTYWGTHSWQSLASRLFEVLESVKPDVMVVNGWNDFGSIITIGCSFLKGIPMVLMSESHEKDQIRKWWKELIKSRTIKLSSGVLVGGKLHREYLLKLRVPSNKIFMGYDVVDNKTFHPDQIKSLPSPLNKPFFLAINRFVTKKNLPFLLSAYANYRQTVGADAWDLVLCGDGELRLQIEQLINQLQIQDSVHLPGFLQQQELLPYFAHASCFIHASIQEQWGLVVNEAMAAGLPVLVSNRCGCYEDLIIEGVNGFGFDPENPQQLTDLMLKISSEDIDLHTMGNAALEHIQKFSPAYFAQGLIQAVNYALSSD